MENAHFIFGFFVPILIAGTAGYLFGKFHERAAWNKIISASGEFIAPTSVKQRSYNLDFIEERDDTSSHREPPI